MYRINVKNLHIAMNTRNNGVVTRSVPTKMAEAMKVSVNPKVAAGNLYGDGGIVADTAKPTGATIAVDATKIPTNIINMIFNRTKDTNGITKDSKTNLSNEFSVGWEVELDDGNSEFVWFTKCKAQPMQSEVQQSEDNVKYSTDTLNITAMPDENGDIRLFGETLDQEFKCATTWFASVPPEPPVTP